MYKGEDRGEKKEEGREGKRRQSRGEKGEERREREGKRNTGKILSPNESYKPRNVPLLTTPTGIQKIKRLGWQKNHKRSGFD